MTVRLSPSALLRAIGSLVVALACWAMLDAVLERGAPPGILLRGLTVGALYALSAIGIVLVYRANGIINFAQVELGSVAAVVAIKLVVAEGWSYVPAVLVGLLMAAALGAVVDLAVVRRFRRAPRLVLAVATIGVSQILAGIALLIPLWWDDLGSGRFSAPFSWSFTFDHITFDANYVLVLFVVPAVLAGLAFFLGRSDHGIAIRAAAENEDRARLVGMPVRRLSTLVWALAAVLSATAVLLRVPLVGFAGFASVSGGGTALLLRALTAAVIARMESLPRAAGAAVLIGVFDEVASSEFSNTSYVDAALVVVILVALLLQRDAFRRSSETGIGSFRSVGEVRPVPAELAHLREVRAASWLLRRGVLAAAATVPLWAGTTDLQAMTLLVIYAIVAVSLLLLTGWAGQISLGQFALVGVGAAVTSVLYGRHGWDFLLAVPVGVAAAALGAVVIGLPALRIRGPFLAVTTLAFALTASVFLFDEQYVPWLIERRIEPPVLWGRIDLGADWVLFEACLVALVGVMAAVGSLRRGPVGRAIIAVRDNEPGAAATRISPTRTKLLAFGASGGIAGLAGALYVVQQGGLAPDAFAPEVSLRLFAMVVIGGLGSVGGAVLGAAYIRGAEFFLAPEWELLASGAGMLLLLLILPDGLGGALQRLRDVGLRAVARRRRLLVPSLLADRRIDDATEVVDRGASPEPPAPGELVEVRT